MVEKDQVFSSSVKYNGIFSFKDFYKFCYDYLTDELPFTMRENKYKEKIIGNAKEVDVEWEGKIKITDYFKYKIKINFKIRDLEKVEIEQGGKKRDTNKGTIEIKMKGNLISDYRGEYETNPSVRFMRKVYDKWIIASKIEQFKDELIEHCDEFLGQAKAYLDLEGKK